MDLRLLLVGLAVLGCKKPDDPGPPPSPPDLQLVSAGNEPRRPLRYRVPKGTKQGLEVAIDPEITAGEMGGPLPTLVMSMLVSRSKTSHPMAA